MQHRSVPVIVATPGAFLQIYARRHYIALSIAVAAMAASTVYNRGKYEEMLVLTLRRIPEQF